jgi:hypothetical protein
MAYNNAIPQPTDQIKNSQSQILSNFQGIKTLIDVDHVTFDLANQGKHNHVTMPVQSAHPVSPGNGAIYFKLSPSSGVNETYVRVTRPGATQTTVAFTSSVLSTTVPVNDMEGWTYLPSGIYLQWGNTAPFNGIITAFLNPAFPTPNKLFTVLPTPYSPISADPVYSVRLIDILSNTDFRLKSSGMTYAKFLAIGY